MIEATLALDAFLVLGHSGGVSFTTTGEKTTTPPNFTLG